MSIRYRALTEHLKGRPDQKWVAKFAELEELLGVALPPSARTHQAWWSNQMRAQSLAWQNAGWKTAGLNLANEEVTFLLADSSELDSPISRADTPKRKALTIAEAKAGLAETFGVDVDAIKIIINA